MSQFANTKIGIVGAGSVGSSLAYVCLIRGIARHVALYDINKARVEAEALDLSHGAVFADAASVSGSDDVEVLRDSDIIFVTAGARQKPNQTRLELVGVNAHILSSLIPNLVRVAPDAIIVVVTNPCDVLTVVAHRVSGLPTNQVFSSGTLLDTSRLRWLLARRAGNIATTSVHASIVGEHGDSEFALWSQATIGPVPLLDWTLPDGTLAFNHDILDGVTNEVRSAAYHVIEGKGATNYAIGLAGGRIAEAVLGDASAILPVSGILSGQWDIDGMALSVPSVVGSRGLEQILDTPMSDGEIKELQASAKTLKENLDAIEF